MTQSFNSMNDEQKRVAILNALAMNFGATIPDLQMKLWINALNEYTIKELQEACSHVIKTYEFKTLPPLAVIVKAIPRNAHSLAGRNPEEELRDKAWAEWMKIQSALDNCVRHPEFEPVTVSALRCIGGYQSILDDLESNLPFRRKEFIECYPRVARYGAEAWGLGAPGIAAVNRHQELPAPEPVTSKTALPENRSNFDSNEQENPRWKELCAGLTKRLRIDSRAKN